ncbi:hypothetical protein BST36_08905 [Mycolicibacterium moriokaense]|uniref:FUSC family protein n=1 Tax=Mycolicibacterium moriokaense TaxID=39691 RepID=A0AAD1HHF8_9MYCO|nr:hypothetical protein [Mycolicibacterium moriokaense]MCV7042096.1 hypothetical protein [Mycolicibacterium moriokaense]ORB25166.1 hypothetical protein BST36_08905 [Mycolicibacterium moriokaense]BBX04865.1 hypothetical protein MMOR_58010 [Mycolicibacterium moriokaense]
MTRSDDSQNTRPISVAELLARNGTIGAPPAGGRRRRRRGATGTISVAELTGEIPIITDRDLARQPVVEEPAEKPVEEPAEPEQPVAEEPAAAKAEPEAQPEAEAEPEAEPTDLSSPAAGNGVVEHADEVEEAEVEEAEVEEAEDPDAATEAEAEDVTEAEGVTDVEEAEAEEAEAEEADAEEAEEADYAGAVSDYTAHIKQREADVDLPFFVPPRRSGTARRLSVVPDAEEMSPDPEPVEDELALDWSDSADTKADEAVDTDGDVEEDTAASKPSYQRTGGDELFGGPTVDDDAAVRGSADTEVIAIDRKAESGGAMSSFMHGVWIVGQCVFAVAFGAGLFVAFDQLWKWNNIVALVLSVLVILGLVVGVRVVRKTEDIGSTLIAVAVGALVTLGPLALLQSG